METLHRRGYRFIAPVESTDRDARRDAAVPSRVPARLRADAPSLRLVVLPFANLSGNPENDYFSDGLSEEILTALTRVPVRS